MMQLVIVAQHKPLRHRLHALAIARTDQPCNIKRTHPPPRLVTQTIQERLKPTRKLIFPPQRHVHHGRPSKSRPPIKSLKTRIRESSIDDQSAKFCQSSAKPESKCGTPITTAPDMHLSIFKDRPSCCHRSPARRCPDMTRWNSKLFGPTSTGKRQTISFAKGSLSSRQSVEPNV